MMMMMIIIIIIIIIIGQEAINYKVPQWQAMRDLRKIAAIQSGYNALQEG